MTDTLLYPRGEARAADSSDDPTRSRRMRMCRRLSEAARPSRPSSPAILKLSKAANLPRATVKLIASKREPRGINDLEDQRGFSCH